MIVKIRKRPGAVQDLLGHYEYMGQRNERIADRFLLAAKVTMEDLAQKPLWGNPWDSDNEELAGLRFKPIKKFPKYLIFYFPRADGIDVVRVLHGSRNTASILGNKNPE